MRQSGDTFRKILGTLSNMSDRPNYHVLFVSGNRFECDYAYRMCWRLLVSTIPDFCKVEGDSNLVQLNNGSLAKFTTIGHLDTSLVRRLRYHELVIDSSIAGRLDDRAQLILEETVFNLRKYEES